MTGSVGQVRAQEATASASPRQWLPVVGVAISAVITITNSPGYFGPWTSMIGVLLVLAVNAVSRFDVEIRRTFLFSFAVAFVWMILLGWPIDFVLLREGWAGLHFYALPSPDAVLLKGWDMAFFLRDLIYMAFLAIFSIAYYGWHNLRARSEP